MIVKRGPQDSIETGESGRKLRSRRRRRRLATHPLFAPILGVWGALLGGLVVMVLPPALALAGGAALGLAGFGELARLGLAGLAAAGLGIPLFAAARGASRRALRREGAPSLVAMAMRHVRPIDPASELGSRHFDDPVETAPFAATSRDAAAAQAAPPAAQAAPAASPRALDLAEFAALEGRNAVWVEDPQDPAPAAAAEPGPAPAVPPEMRPKPRPAPVPRPVQDRVIAQLRAVPPSELSLIQMVERFAAALHERQSAATAGEGRRPVGDERDALLAEALKALAELSGQTAQEGAEEPLRDAVTRLQGLRGAA